MPGFAEREAEIQNHFRNTLRAKRAGILIAWDNVDFNPPKNSEWVRFSLRPVLHGSAGMVEHCHRDEGIIFVQCFVPRNEGTAEMYVLIDDVVEVFHGIRVGGTYFNDVSPRILGVRDSYFSANVDIEYTSDWSTQ